MIGEKNFPIKNGAGTVPPPQDGEYTVDDLKTALEESEWSLHDAVFTVRQVWEKDCDAVKLDIDDLAQIESALQEICNITTGIDNGDDGEQRDAHMRCGNYGACALFRVLVYTVSGLHPEIPTLF